MTSSHWKILTAQASCTVGTALVNPHAMQKMQHQILLYKARPAASRPSPPTRLPTPVTTAATPDDDELAALDAAAPAVFVVVEPAPPFSPLKLSRLVHVASKELAFIQLEPIVVFEPLTKLTAAHCV